MLYYYVNATLHLRHKIPALQNPNPLKAPSLKSPDRMCNTVYLHLTLNLALGAGSLKINTNSNNKIWATVVFSKFLMLKNTINSQTLRTVWNALVAT